MKISKILLLVLLMGFLVLTPSIGSFSTESTAEVSTLSASKTVDPGSWEEMLPGVFVRYYWFNKSESYDLFRDSGEDNAIEDPLTFLNNTDTDPSWNPYVIIVYDTEENPYYIEIEEEWTWKGWWNITQFFVEILTDPDRSFVGKLNTLDPVIRNIDIAGLSGDEAYYSTAFYMTDWSYSYSINKNYTWYDQFDKEVDPNDIIPNLAPEYEWASCYNESFEYSDEGRYSMFGYSVYQHTLLKIAEDSFTILAVEHFFQGMSVFNDINGNGIIDVSYGSASEYEDNISEIISDASHVYSADRSELVYDVWMTGATLDEITVPHVMNNQIDWGFSLTDVSAELWDVDYGIFVSDPIAVPDADITIIERKRLEVVIPNIDFVFTFLIEESTAMLKIDQIVGDFNDKDTGVIHSELKGLSLTINYWSTIYHTATETEKDYELTLSDENANSPETISTDEIVYNSSEWEDGIEFEMSFEDVGLNLIPLSIAFGGVYTWTYDNNEYKVGTVMIPLFTFTGDIYHQAGLSDNYEFRRSHTDGTYYYSSCYEYWDGYGIIHDPTFSAIIGNKVSNGGSSSGSFSVPGFLVINLLAGLATLGGILGFKRKRKDKV